MTRFSSAGRTFGTLTLESFRLNSELVAAGDALSRDLNMSSARWQVMGTLSLAMKPISVSEVARRMGLARQSVQRTMDWLAENDLVRYEDNPRDRRARLAAPSKKGKRIYEELEVRRVNWAEAVVRDIPQEDIETALHTLRLIRARMVVNN